MTTTTQNWSATKKAGIVFLAIFILFQLIPMEWATNLLGKNILQIEGFQKIKYQDQGQNQGNQAQKYTFK